MSSVLRVKEPFAYDKDGVPHVLRAGDLVAADDPCVTGREALFEPAEDAAARTRVIETATAVPGEVRTLPPRRPGKPDAK